MSIKVVVGYPYSDIGKGWLTSSIGVQMKKPLIFKIDPMLNKEFPKSLGVFVNGICVTDDAHSYMQRNLPFSPECNVIMGKFFADTLCKPPIANGLLKNDIQKLTYADMSAYLAEYIRELMQKFKKENAVIEIGGCPDDMEAKTIPGAIRLLHERYQVGIILLTRFDHSDVGGKIDVKTKGSVRAIEETMREYWNLPLGCVFIRRASVPLSITDEVLEDACKRVAFKTQVNSKKIVYLPNVEKIDNLDQYVRQMFTFDKNKSPK